MNFLFLLAFVVVIQHYPCADLHQGHTYDHPDILTDILNKDSLVLVSDVEYVLKSDLRI